MEEDRMDEERFDPALTEVLRSGYNRPPETPREEMWAAIQSGLTPRGAAVHSLEDARAARNRAMRWRRPAAWVAAAAAVLVVGIGIGRMSVGPAAAPRPVAEAGRPDAGVLRVAALDHLGRTESLLRLVRADSRDGRVDPAMGSWARTLLAQTRLLLDAPGTEDPAMRMLLEDLELVLMQIVGVTELEGGDALRTRSEMELALEGLEERDVLPRIQAVIPAGAGFAGT